MSMHLRICYNSCDTGEKYLENSTEAVLHLCIIVLPGPPHELKPSSTALGAGLGLKTLKKDGPATAL